MPIHEPLSDAALDEVIAFVHRANPFAQKMWGWDSGRFMDWRWGFNALRDVAHPGWFGANCRVFRDGGRIRTLWIAEEGGADSCILTEAEDPDAVWFVLDRLEQQRSGPDVGLRFEVSDAATWLRDVFRAAGLHEQEFTGHEWEYELNRRSGGARIPEGFVVDSLGDDRDADYTGIAECIRAAFGSERDVAATLRSIERNPMFRPELSVFVRSPDGRVAAYCRGTVNPGNGVCGIDPVCTHPDFQRMGLARAVIQTCFARQRALGGRFSYIGSAPEPAPSTVLYRSLGPSSRTLNSTWSRS
jgi:GNAT superfamily N-acetyltransferase